MGLPSKGALVSTVHVVGLDHFLHNVTDLCWTEDGKKDEKQQKAALADLWRKIIEEAEVELIAEEGLLDDSGLGAVLAKEIGKSHIDTTMPIIEREKRGVKTPDYDKSDSIRKAAYRIFEQYMFEEVQAENDNVVLIMVGRHQLKVLVRLHCCGVRCESVRHKRLMVLGHTEGRSRRGNRPLPRGLKFANWAGNAGQCARDRPGPVLDRHVTADRECSLRGYYKTVTTEGVRHSNFRGPPLRPASQIGRQCARHSP
jgi:hypothetical protein